MTTRRRRKPTTSKAKTVQLPDPLDPVFPLPAFTEIPTVLPGDGETILNDTRMMVVEMPYRAFFMMWEYAERFGNKNYPRYINRTDHMQPVAQAALEAVHAFRSAFRGEVLPMMEEQAARESRQLRAQMLAELEAKKSKGTKKASDTNAAAKDEHVHEDDEPVTAVKPGKCPSVKRGVHCRGPAGHKSKLHKGRTKSGREVSWRDDEEA